MRKDLIDCYIEYGWIGHLVDVQGKTDHHEYVNICQQHLLASAVGIFENQKPNYVLQLDNGSHIHGHRFPGLITRISSRDCHLDVS